MRAYRFVGLWLIAGVLLATAQGSRNGSPQENAGRRVADPDPSRWEKAIHEFEEWDSRNSPPQNAVLFVGSSSIRGWRTHEFFPKLTVINRGFGGSYLSEVNHFFPRIVQPYHPRVIVVYAGDNDIADDKSPEQVADDYREFVRLVRAQWPDTPAIYISIKPSLARWDKWPSMKRANKLIEELTRNDARLFYADTAASTLGDDGKPRGELLVEDGLHLNRKGYQVWSDVVAPLIDEALRLPSKAAGD